MIKRATFDLDEWRGLTLHDKRALRAFFRVGIDFEPLTRVSGLDQQGMDSLVAKGLAIEGHSRLGVRTFKVTNKGWLAVDWLHRRTGRR